MTRASAITNTIGEIPTHRAPGPNAACNVNQKLQYRPGATFHRQWIKVWAAVLKYDLFSRKRLLFVAGTTGCCKSTCFRPALGNKPLPLPRKILKKAFKRSDFKTQQLFSHKLQKRYERQEGCRKFTRTYNNFIQNVDKNIGPNSRKCINFPQISEKL